MRQLHAPHVPDSSIISSTADISAKARIAGAPNLTHSSFVDLGGDRVLIDRGDGGDIFAHWVSCRAVYASIRPPYIYMTPASTEKL
jgi:hypothetical protein